MSKSYGLPEQERASGWWKLPVVAAMAIALLCLTIAATTFLALPSTSVIKVPLRGGGSFSIDVGSLTYKQADPTPISRRSRGTMQVDIWYRPILSSQRHYVVLLPAWPMLVFGGAALLAAGVSRRRATRTTRHRPEVQYSESDIPT
jgi:hypothetical protein